MTSATSSNERTNANAAAAWAIRAVVFAAFLDLYTQLPVMATYAVSLGASATMSGVIVGAYSASNIFGNLFAGLLLDSLNRRRVIIVGMALTAAALFAYGFVESPSALLALRLAHGLAAGALTPGAFAMLGDRARSEHAKAMGASGAIIAVAAIVGFPLSSAIEGLLGYEWIFRASGLIMLCAMAAFALLARDAPAAPTERAAPTAQDAPRFPLRDAFLGMIYAIVLAMTYCIGSLTGYLPIAIERADLAPYWSGICFTVFAVVAVAIMATPAQRSLDGKSRSLAIALGMALIGGGGAGLALAALIGGGGGAAAYALALMVAMMCAFGLGFGFVFPSLGAAVSERGGGRRGIAFGVFYAIYSLGVFIGSSASGAASDALGAVAPFAVSAAVALIALPIAAALRKRG